MSYNSYIDDQILEIYMDDLDTVVSSFYEEIQWFDSEILNEDDNTQVANTNNDNKPDNADNNKGGGKFAGKLKELFEKLKGYLDKFIEALGRVTDIIKTKATKFLALLEGKFKNGGKATADFTVIKYDVVQKNVNALDNLIKKVDNEIINPVESNQSPKNNDTGEYENAFAPLEYKKVVEDKGNFYEFKKGANIGANIISASGKTAEQLTKISEASVPRNKQYRQKLNTVIPKTEGSGSEDASADLKLLSTALYFNIKLHQNLQKYCSKLVGDNASFATNCDGANVKGGATPEPAAAGA